MGNGPQEWPLLPRQSEPDASLMRPQPQRERRQGPGYSIDDPLRISATWSSERRRGRWVLPPYVTAAPSMSNIVLDFRDAVLESTTVHLTVEGMMGGLRLVVPEGWGIDTDRLAKGIGSIHNRIGPLALPDHPLVVVTGTVGMGSFTASRERFYERWARRRRQGPQEILR